MTQTPGGDFVMAGQGETAGEAPVADGAGGYTWAGVASASSTDAIGRTKVIAPGGTGLRDFVSVKDALGASAAVMDGVTDDGPAVRALYNAMMTAGGKGTMYVPAGTLFANTSGQGSLLPLTRSNDPTRPMLAWRLQGAGMDQTTILLSSNTPRLTDLNKQADNDVFSNWAIWDLTVNGGGIGGNQHVIAGTYQGGSFQTRVGGDRITLRRVRTVNIASSNTGANDRRNVCFVTRHLADNEVTQHKWTNILAEDCDFTGGGNYGVQVCGTSPGNSANVLYDQVSLVRVKHDTLLDNHALTSTSSAGLTTGSANFHFGSGGIGNKFTMSDCFGANSVDVGIEGDCPQDGTVYSTTIQDSLNVGFFCRNFNTPTNQAAQRMLWHGCTYRLVTLTPTAAGYKASAFGPAHADTTGQPTFGHVEIIACLADMRGPNITYVGSVIDAAATKIEHLTVRDLTIGFDAINDSASQGGRLLNIYPRVNSRVEIDGVRLKTTGTMSGATATLQAFQISPSNSAQLTGFVRKLAWDQTGLTTGQTGTTTAVQLSVNGLVGTLRDFEVSDFAWVGGTTGDVAPKGIAWRAVASGLTIAGKLKLWRNDFTNSNGGNLTTNLILPADNLANVDSKSNTFSTWPLPPVAITIAVGAPTVWQNTLIYDVDLKISGGTGTLIEKSTDAGANWTTVYTQAAGAFTNVPLIPVRNGESVRVTSTVQATATAIPVR